MGMRIIDTMRTSTAVVWSKASPDGYGKTSFGNPKEIIVRWQNKMEIFRNDAGQDEVSEAQVFPGEDLSNGDYLFEGELSDLAQSQKNNPQAIAYKIRAWAKIPTLDGTQYVRKAYL